LEILISSQFARPDELTRAGNGAWTATSRDLYSAFGSAMQAGGVSASLEWDTYPPTAGKEKGPSRGFGGRAPDLSALGAAGTDRESGGLSSLDSITNNRNKETFKRIDSRPQNRGKYCGRLSVTGTDAKTGRKVFRRINCGAWSCSYCGPRKARTARAAIRSVAEGLGLRYFLTLTLDPKNLPGGRVDSKIAVSHLRECFNKFRIYLKREYGVPPSYICVLEFTQAGLPHLHILFDRYIPQRWISNVWARLGGGRIVFIKQVTVANVSRYLSKYLTKELLLSAPKGTRRITTARSIKLFPKFIGEIQWGLIKRSIWNLIFDYRSMQAGVERDCSGLYVLPFFDEEDFLNRFEVALGYEIPVELEQKKTTDGKLEPCEA